MKNIDSFSTQSLSLSLSPSRCVDANPSDRPPQRGQGLRQWQLCPQRGTLHADWLLRGLLHPTGHHGGDILPHHTGSGVCVCLPNTLCPYFTFFSFFFFLLHSQPSSLPSLPGAPEAGHCLPVRGKDFLPAAFAHTSIDKHVTASNQHLPPSSDQHNRPFRLAR